MASRPLATIYSKLLSRMPVGALRTLAPSYSNSESGIRTNYSDSNSRSKQLRHAGGKKNRAFNRFLKPKQGLKLWVADNSLHTKAVEEVDDDPLSAEVYRRSYYGNIYLPQSRYNMGKIVMELKNIVFNRKPQMMTRNTCDSRRWFTSCIDADKDAANVESNAFSTNEAGDAINGTLHRMVRAIYIKEGKFPNFDNLIADLVSFIKEGQFQNFDMLIGFCQTQHLFFEQKHNIILENYGLYKMVNSDWHVAGVSKSRYMSIDSFMWWFLRIPNEYKKWIYNYMFKQQIYVIESCPANLLTHYTTFHCWDAPPDEFYKLNISGFFKETLGGTKEASCGEVLRDFRGRILEIFHKPLPDATSRDEVVLLGVHHGIDEILQKRSEAKKIILGIDHKKIFKVLRREERIPKEYFELYHKIFHMLLQFDDYDILFQYPQENVVANRVAYIASSLTVGQS
ncbi:uncharacterized protein LOC132280047 [Cornus florida]|uniref:uncharacterized protein LOC132280047 n=1 Tax=Cornus florida TaxID=4283 RepID=UPI00289CB335|nr:uncharacterized protein LOC132280047 [Cornus florida]XP_059638134.1 uncharacterized protein LOC132280047 [Cornus florida]XP_059638135.1 uncharacterized protein LOC132280047 [Cornus florida]